MIKGSLFHPSIDYLYRSIQPGSQDTPWTEQTTIHTPIDQFRLIN